MTREEAIRTVEALWPPDSPDPDTAVFGWGLLVQAVVRSWCDIPASAWRKLPPAMLVRLATLQKQTERDLRERKGVTG